MCQQCAVSAVKVTTVTIEQPIEYVQVASVSACSNAPVPTITVKNKCAPCSLGIHTEGGCGCHKIKREKACAIVAPYNKFCA